MTFNDWSELRAHAIHLFNETPHPQTEQDIIDAYQNHPDKIEDAIYSVAADVAAGTARSGWGVLRARAARINTPVANPTRNESVSREKTITSAEQWIRAAGLHYDREDEILLTLFDTTGRLHTYAQTELVNTTPDNDHPTWALSPITGDHVLAKRMTNIWREVRPKGEAVEQAAQHRADQWKENRWQQTKKSSQKPNATQKPPTNGSTQPEQEPTPTDNQTPSSESATHSSRSPSPKSTTATPKPSPPDNEVPIL